VWVSTCVLASRHGTILPSYQIHPSRSAMDIVVVSPFPIAEF
jgi:hypothetical protein